MVNNNIRLNLIIDIVIGTFFVFLGIRILVSPVFELKHMLFDMRPQHPWGGIVVILGGIFYLSFSFYRYAKKRREE